MHLNFFISDYMFFLMLGIICITLFVQRKSSAQAWGIILSRPSAMAAMIVLLCFLIITALDCLHVFGLHASVLDKIMGQLGATHELTYSAPLASFLAVAQSSTQNGIVQRVYPHLSYVVSNGFVHNKYALVVAGFVVGAVIAALLATVIVCLNARRYSYSFYQSMRKIITNQTELALRCAVLTIFCISIFLSVLFMLSTNFHVLGTDQIGSDVLYQSLKSIRTGVLIGTLTTGIMLPFALLLGPLAGFLRGWVDDVIQYIYTTLSAIPGVLLISACILAIGLYFDRHGSVITSNESRADLRLIVLCIVLGLTSWTSLCRLLRAETLKLRGAEYIQAARCMRVSNFKIIRTHILPNVMHIVIITIALDFSGLVLAEAVLSYIGVGVDPNTISWGQMINSSRLEMARHPVVWWPLASAMFWMFSLVLSANIFSDALRDALDPHYKKSTKLAR
jgi:peptide/nickel transport system permease protein